ncbi:MAG: ABC transporter ATP-binding protein [Lachnospiraceae bacterium]|nr:ABC transporter ATP-binding protein [Lachnospiraceae bacterium]
MPVERTSGEKERLLEVKDLHVSFFTPAGEVHAVNGVSYHVDKEEVVAIVGESGCGKSVTQMSVIQLIQTPPGKIMSGEVLFEGKDLLKLDRNSKEMRGYRGSEISIIFQEPMTSLNPIFTIGKQMTDIIRTHQNVSKKEAVEIAVKALEAVGIPEPAARMKNYPFELSGGMRQRVLIAFSVACHARLIIADEPTTALDVTTQAQVMEVLLGIVRTYKSSLVVVTHNLGLVSRYADRIYVMYAGRVIESGTTEELLVHPQHPYTKGLLNSVPKLDDDKNSELEPIDGTPPNLLEYPEHCAFAPRCPMVCEQCRTQGQSELRHVAGHYVACHVIGEEVQK